MSQKELQRVEVISQCVKGNLACARAAELLDLTPRHVKRLKARYRQGSAAALAHANRVLRSFISDYNRRFARAPRGAAKAWRSAPENLERICCFTHQRVVSNDNVVQWDGRQLLIPPQSRRFSFAGARVEICQALDGRVSL